MIDDMNIRRNIALLVYMAGLLFMSSCDVHEFPDPKIHYKLDMVFDMEMPLYKIVEYGEQKTRSSFDEYDVRYKVNVFDGKDQDNNDVLYSFVFTKDDVSVLDHTVTIPLPRGEYRFAVWTDYVIQDTELDLFYDSDDFNYISFAEGDHIGSNDMRDAFMGVLVSEVSKDIAQGCIEMKRPMGKFNFIASDAGNYDLDGYKVIFNYKGFVPSAFNLHTSKPTDSKAGVRFSSGFKRLNDNEAELGFDYVFVNGKETVVSVFVEVYDPAGKLLSRSTSIDVPVVRSKLTTVKAEFLTMESGGGVSLDPDYDGEFNILTD